MSHIFNLSCFLFLCINLANCTGQTPIEKLDKLSDDFDKSPPFEYKMPTNILSNDTSPGWNLKGQKILLTGIVYEIDGRTPASNIVLYYYQTDTHGKYSTNPAEPRNMPKNKLGQTHGYIRGWVKTGADGRYSIHTIMPGSYPSRNEAAHIHVSIKENSTAAPYYIDNFVFDDDPLLTSEKRKKMENRCGSGVIRFVHQGNTWIGERNIILGLNVPDHPQNKAAGPNSGKQIGEDVNSFTPFHAYGADKGSIACPICKYGWYHGILYFVGENPNWEEIKKWLTFLDEESIKKENYLKVYFIYGNETGYDKSLRMNELESLGTELDLKKVALTFVPSFTDRSSDIYLNKINPDVQNTFLIYKRSIIVGKYIDLKPTEENFRRINDRLDETTNEYFKFEKPKHD